MKAAAAPTTRISTGAGLGRTSIASSAAVIRRPAHGPKLDSKRIKIFEAKPLPAKDPKGIAGKMGEIVAVDADGFTVVCADGRFKVTRVQADGPKIDGRRIRRQRQAQPRYEVFMIASSATAAKAPAVASQHQSA